jgi:glutathione S-transferase
VTVFLPLLTVTLALASVIEFARSFRPLVLFFALGYTDAAGEAYRRTSLASGLAACAELCAGWWLNAAAFGVAVAVLAVLWRREQGRA